MAGYMLNRPARLLALAQYKVLLYVTANMVQFIFVLQNRTEFFVAGEPRTYAYRSKMIGSPQLGIWMFDDF